MMTPEVMAELTFPLDGSDPDTVFECRRRAAKMIDVDRHERNLVELIAQAIEERPGDKASRAAELIRDTDPDDDLWNCYIGPMLDSLEDDYGKAATHELTGVWNEGPRWNFTYAYMCSCGHADGDYTQEYYAREGHAEHAQEEE